MSDLKQYDVVRLRGVNSTKLRAYGVVETVGSFFITLYNHKNGFFRRSSLLTVETSNTSLEDKITILNSLSNDLGLRVIARGVGGNKVFYSVDNLPLSILDSVFFVETDKKQFIL